MWQPANGCQWLVAGGKGTQCQALTNVSSSPVGEDKR